VAQAFALHGTLKVNIQHKCLFVSSVADGGNQTIGRRLTHTGAIRVAKGLSRERDMTRDGAHFPW